MRLYPVTPILPPRVANKHTVLPLGGGMDGKSPLFVPKGTALIVNIHSANRRQEVYGEDAEEFKPERWEYLRPGWVSPIYTAFTRPQLTFPCSGLHSFRWWTTNLRWS
jgi:cytochrome P450